MKEEYVYPQDAMEILKKQEELFHYPSFVSADALRLGNVIAETALEYDREVSIRIVRESDELTVFQYMMDSKAERNIYYMEGKRQAVLKSGHSSGYVYVAHETGGEFEDLFQDMTKVMPVGGAVPIIVGDKHVMTVMVSGLHEGKDHELLIRSIAKDRNQKYPDFPYHMQ